MPSSGNGVNWWVQLGFPPFDAGTGDDQGFPNPGQVVSYYRRHKEVVREDGSRHTCRQVDLANMLGVSESWVRAMETQNKGLDSISRRRVLSLALAIPPVLFGLVPAHEALAKSGGALEVTSTTINWLNDSLGEAWQLYYTSSPYNVKDGVDRKVEYLEVFTTTDNENLRQQIQTLQCRFYHLSARIASDQTQYKDAYKYIQRATKIAESLGNKELLAASYFWRGRTYLEESRFPAAVTALDKALSYAKDEQGKLVIPLALYGGILLEDGLAHAYTANTQRDKNNVLDIFKQAKPVVQKAPENDNNFIMVNLGRYYHFKAEALIAMKMPDEALTALDQADLHTSPHFTRRKAYISILRAKAALDMKDYSYAAHQALDAVNACKAIDSGVNLDFLKSINRTLNASPFASSEAVSKLNIALHNA